MTLWFALALMTAAAVLAVLWPLARRGRELRSGSVQSTTGTEASSPAATGETGSGVEASAAPPPADQMEPAGEAPKAEPGEEPASESPSVSEGQQPPPMPAIDADAARPIVRATDRGPAAVGFPARRPDVV